MRRQCVVVVAALGLYCLALAHVGAELVLPVITSPAKGGMMYKPNNGNFTIQCKANGNPVYQWYDGETLVEPQRKNGITYLSVDTRSGDLRFQKFNELFNGDYRCKAQIDGGATTMSEVINLREIKLGAFDPKPPSSYNVDEYQYHKLVCSNKGEIVIDPDQIVYHWYKNREAEQILSKRMFIDLEGTLHFTYVLKDDETNNNKQYVCAYTSLAQRVSIYGNGNLMDVKQANSPTSDKPIFQYSNHGKAVAVIGSTATLECFFSGYHTGTVDHLPIITWSDGQNDIVTNDKYTLEDSNRILKIKQVQEKDDKNFFCRAETAGQNKAQEQAVHLNVTSRPIWVKAPETVTKPERSNAVFNCMARSVRDEESPSKPVWYINSKKVEPNNYDFKKYIFSNDNKVLTVRNVQKPDDIICVQCTVENSVGVLMGDACLNVVKAIAIYEKPASEQEIRKGDIIHLTVRAEADTGPSNELQYEWVYSNTTYDSFNLPPHVIYDKKTHLAYINTTNLEQDEYEGTGGVYAIRIYNNHDSKTVYTSVKVMDAVPAPVTASASINMWLIGLIVGIIFLIIVVAIIIFVICRRQQEGDYNVDKKETGAGLDPEKELRDKGFNDLSRPDYDDYDYPGDNKSRGGDIEYDDVPIGDDESLGEYGDEEDTAFNEDGSFIGIYQKKGGNHQGKTESTI